jgi:acid phosphatase
MSCIPRTTLALIVLWLGACQPAAIPTPAAIEWTPMPVGPTLAPLATTTPLPTPLPPRRVPVFDRIVVIVFAEKEYGNVLGNARMPYFNVLASAYTVLENYHAVAHPALPNYLALISGDTHGLTSDCEDCSIDAPALPDLIEQSGRSWRTYQESMPEPCFAGSTVLYLQEHNPFVYLDAIRLRPQRCAESVVPFGQLDIDIANGRLPDFIFITPNVCHSGRDCALDQADLWLDSTMDRLVPALENEGQPYLIFLVWDQGRTDQGCCGLPEPAGGRVPAVLISPLVKTGYRDPTPYTHYSLLKTIAESWGLSFLGHAGEDDQALMTAPWR